MKLVVRMLLLVAMAANLLLFLQYSNSNFPIIIPSTEALLMRASNIDDFKKSEANIKSAVTLSPTRALPHVLLAIRLDKKNAGITPNSIEEIRKSYEILPIGYDGTEQRLFYIFSNWNQMPADLKSKAQYEASVLATTGYGRTFLNKLSNQMSPSVSAVILIAILRGNTLQKLHAPSEL